MWDEKKKGTRESLLCIPLSGRGPTHLNGSIRQKVNPDESETAVRTIRQTRSGAVLLEINSSNNQTLFKKALNEALGQDGTIRSITPRITLEILDMDTVTTEQDVEEAINRELQVTIPNLKVGMTKPNSRGQKLGIVDIDAEKATELLNKEKIRIGWIYCRIRKRTLVTRCYRCLDFGHQARECKGPDRSKLCYRCGKPGHRSKGCTSEFRCILCVSNDANSNHALGTGECTAFRKALATVKTRQK